MWKFLHKLASPPHFYRIAKIMIPWLAVPGYLLIVYGVFVGLFVAPAYPVDQGVSARIIYVHVASAYLSMMGYMIMAVAGGIGYIWRMKLAHAVAASAAPLGASFTFLALVTGSIWGRPTWGTYWEWSDPRLVSELILLFLYFGYMALRSAIDDTAKADKASAILALVGAVNIPIIHYSVYFLNSIHQTSSLAKADGPSIDADMLPPLFAMIIGFTLVYGSLLLRRVRSEVLFRERRTNWVKDMILSPGGQS
jgi:heme exporter protein C